MIRWDEAEQLFSKAWQSEKAGDYVSAAQYYKKAAEYGHSGAQNNLGNLYKNGQGVTRDPQEAVRLFTLSANQGNVAAMRNLASCYLDGVGTDADFELAVTWLKRAAMPGDHLACAMLAKAYDSGQHKNEEKKIYWQKWAAEYGNSDSMLALGGYYGKKGENQVYEANVENEMPAKVADPYSHGKEYFRGNIDPDIAEYNGLFYFLRGLCLCTSDEQGNNIKIVSIIPGKYFYGSIHVNCTGIYLYYTRDGGLSVLHLDFDGTQLAERKEEYECGEDIDDFFSGIYFYGNDLFYVYEHYADEERECCIKCMHIDTGITEKIYDRASRIDELYATDGYIIFSAEYENDERRKIGWMIMNTKTKEVECISNPYCSPENVIDHPSYYDPESSDYNEKCDFDRKIIFFDLSRKIFWIQRGELEGDDLHLVIYWEPRNLWGNRDELVSGMPVWRINRCLMPIREYFDGIVHYWSEDCNVLKSSSKFGQNYDWSSGKWEPEKWGPGDCHNFKIVGGYLFLNIGDEGEKQYPLTVGVSSPIRKSWFDKYTELPRDEIEEFKKTRISK